MQLVETKNVSGTDPLRRLYDLSFPESEKKPFEMIESMQAAGHADIFRLEDPDFAGLLITMKDDSMLLVDYLAVAPERQGHGVGSRALDAFGLRYPQRPVVLEIEDPAGAGKGDLRIRRQRFYENNGFVMMDYTVGLFGVPMKIMVRGGTVSFEDYRDFLLRRLGDWAAPKICLL